MHSWESYRLYVQLKSWFIVCIPLSLCIYLVCTRNLEQVRPSVWSSAMAASASHSCPPDWHRDILYEHGIMEPSLCMASTPVKVNLSLHINNQRLSAQLLKRAYRHVIWRMVATVTPVLSLRPQEYDLFSMYFSSRLIDWAPTVYTGVVVSWC